MKGQYLFTLGLVAILSYFIGEVGLNSRPQTFKVTIQKITWMFSFSSGKIQCQKIALHFQQKGFSRKDFSLQQACKFGGRHQSPKPPTKRTVNSSGPTSCILEGNADTDICLYNTFPKPYSFLGFFVAAKKLC